MRPLKLREVRSGSHFDDYLADAIEHAITAGACRHAGRLNPDNAATWNAVAEAHRRDARAALRRFQGSRATGD